MAIMTMLMTMVVVLRMMRMMMMTMMRMTMTMTMMMMMMAMAMIDKYLFELWAIQLITGPKEMQSPERLYDYAIYNGELVHFSI